MNDPDDLLQREPLVAMFRVRGPPPQQAFTFVLIDMHTEPDDNAKKELQCARAGLSGGPPRLRRTKTTSSCSATSTSTTNTWATSARIDGVCPIVRHTYTNTRQNNQYDNIIIHQPSTTEFTGRWGVFNFEQLYHLTRDQALEVSDHFPVWAEFNAYESTTPGRVAARGTGVHTQ